jgi:hypothetical protein
MHCLISNNTMTKNYNTEEIIIIITKIPYFTQSSFVKPQHLLGRQDLKLAKIKKISFSVSGGSKKTNTLIVVQDSTKVPVSAQSVNIHTYLQ